VDLFEPEVLRADGLNAVKDLRIKKIPQNFFCGIFQLFSFEAGDGETPTYVPM